LDNPDQLLTGVVEVQLDLIRGRTNGLVTSELELSDQVLVGVLGETAALVSVQENIVNIQRGSDQRLVIGNGGGDGGVNVVLGGSTVVFCRVAAQRGDGPQALVNGAEIQVNLDFVILESDQRQCQTGVCAKPELKGDIQGGLGEGVTGSAHLAGSHGVTRSVNISE